MTKLEMRVMAEDSLRIFPGTPTSLRTGRILVVFKQACASHVASVSRAVVELDDERRAAMVSNLMVVLCGERDTQPIVNAGSLYQ